MKTGRWRGNCGNIEVMRILSCILAAMYAWCAAASAEMTVDSARALEKAVRMAGSGETIRVSSGRYDLSDLKIPRNLTLIGDGDGDVVFFSSVPVAKGILNPLWASSFRVENIRFEGVRSPDLNGAGIRHDGADLTIVNCIFENNDDGVLATGQERGRISIIGSQFIGNGHGDGYSHGIYVASGGVLDIRASRFIGTKIGHHVKSLAARTSITDSFFDDASGRTSYAVDASRGGAVSITHNTFLHAADGDNPTLINYDLTRGGEAVSLEIIGNRIVNRNRYGRLLRNDTPVTPIISDNNIINENRGRMPSQDNAPVIDVNQ